MLSIILYIIESKERSMRKRDIPSKATDPEIARLDTIDGCGADDENACLLQLPKNFSRVPLKNTLSDQHDRFDLRISQALKRAAVDATATERVDDNINVRVLGVVTRAGGILDGFDVDLIATPRTKGTISVMCMSGRRERQVFLQASASPASGDPSRRL